MINSSIELPCPYCNVITKPLSYGHGNDIDKESYQLESHEDYVKDRTGNEESGESKINNIQESGHRTIW